MTRLILPSNDPITYVLLPGPVFQLRKLMHKEIKQFGLRHRQTAGKLQNANEPCVFSPDSI
jgi:hypothetical protein